MISEELKRAVDSLALADIVLSAINAKVREAYAIGVKLPELVLFTLNPHPVSIQVFDPAEASGESRRIQFLVRGGAKLKEKLSPGATKPDDGEAIVASVETDFLVTYVEKPGAGLDADSLSAFAESNVPFNVWPYWREIVHATFGRMGLPRIVLPLHRMKKSDAKSLQNK